MNIVQLSFYIFLLLSTSVFAELQKNQELDSKEKIVMDASKTEGLEDVVLKDFLANPTNPFLTLLPDEPIKAATTPTKSEVPKTEKSNKIPDSVLQASEGMHLEGLTWGTDQPQAIINGQLLSEGESFGDAKVIKISQKGVQIKYNGYSIFIKNKIE